MTGRIVVVTKSLLEKCLEDGEHPLVAAVKARTNPDTIVTLLGEKIYLRHPKHPPFESALPSAGVKFVNRWSADREGDKLEICIRLPNWAIKSVDDPFYRR